MKIPQVNDAQLFNLIGGHVAPVVVLFEEIDHLAFRHNRTIFELAAVEHEDKLVFASILIDENPTLVQRIGMVRADNGLPIPGVIAFHNQKNLGYVIETLNFEKFCAFLEMVAQHAPRPPLGGSTSLPGSESP